MPYIPHTKQDIHEMLEVIGITNVEELFDEIPAELKIKLTADDVGSKNLCSHSDVGSKNLCSHSDVGSKNLCSHSDVASKNLCSEQKPSKDFCSLQREMSVAKLMQQRAKQNREMLCFIGAGAYEHYIPAPVWNIASRGEFMTAYTPYQAEASQGTLQVIYEYQTMMANLTGMEVSNASLYDGASALAEAALMAVRIGDGKEKKILMPVTVHPYYREVVHSIVKLQNIEIITIPFDQNTGAADLNKLNEYAAHNCAALIIPQPNFFGALEPVDELTNWAHHHGMLAIAVVNPTSLAMLKEPAKWGNKGVDIACGSGQPLGIPLASGGPYFGFLTCRKDLIRQMPGRIVGRTVDTEGKAGFVLTLQAREQHIRRSKATSNICTNQGLMATAATIYLSLLGARGLKQVALTSHEQTKKLVEQVTKIHDVKLLFNTPFFHEAVLQLPKSASLVVDEMAKVSIQAGFALSTAYEGMENALLVCCTETKTDEDINLFVHALQKILIPSFVETPCRASVRDQGVIETPCRASVRDQGVVETPYRASLLRTHKLSLPQLSELQVVRHFTKLSQKNFSVDTNFYPLGSCTMKYNPQIATTLVALFANIHPLTRDIDQQGYLSCIYELQAMLQDVTGMVGASLTPMAGAQGELAGVAMIKAYHQSRGDVERTEMLVPDAAHGTNPASAAMCGYQVKEIPTDKHGDIDLEALQKAVSNKTAGIMLTNPSTCGVFERRITDIAKIVHAAGGLLYYDGANLNAILGKVRPGDMGFDVIHLNLHKTFGTPHGGGGPGAGPVMANKKLVEFLPIPYVIQSADEYVYITKKQASTSIGRLSAFMGNSSILLRAYIYLKLIGSEGLARVAENAVLNANYLMKRLQQAGFTLAFPERRASHEFIISLAASMKKHHIGALDYAKRLLDYGIHAPTTYFPLLVPECLLIEPTETESKEELDNFVAAMINIKREVEEDPELVTGAPRTMPVRRLDNVKAAKELDVRSEK